MLQSTYRKLVPIKNIVDYSRGTAVFVDFHPSFSVMIGFLILFSAKSLCVVLGTESGPDGGGHGGRRGARATGTALVQRTSAPACTETKKKKWRRRWRSRRNWAQITIRMQISL